MTLSTPGSSLVPSVLSTEIDTVRAVTPLLSVMATIGLSLPGVYRPPSGRLSGICPIRNTRAAIRPDGTLLLIENMVDSADRPAGLMDLLMLIVGGRERTEADFRSLLDSTRFSLTHIIPTEASWLIEFHPA